jgi:integrase
MVRDQFDRVRERLPEDLKDFCLFGYLTAMRLDEIKSLAWSAVTEDHGKIVIRLAGRDAKTKQPRSIVVAGELVPLIQRRKAARTVKTDDGVTLSALIFHRGDGERVGEFRKSWKTACVAAGAGKWICRKCQSEGTEKSCDECNVDRKYVGAIFYDTRRSGIRNLIRSGVSQTVAMKISGHTTTSTFRRYDITSEEDIASAFESVAEYHEKPAQNVVAMKG